jgi:hypothetical protein
MKLAYRILAFGCLLALVTNTYKHGWSIGGFCLPAALALLLFSLSKDGGKHEVLRYCATLSIFVGLFCFVIYKTVIG